MIGLFYLAGAAILAYECAKFAYILKWLEVSPDADADYCRQLAAERRKLLMCVTVTGAVATYSAAFGFVKLFG